MNSTLEQKKTDFSIIDKLNKEAWKINRTDPHKAIELSKKALDKSKKTNYKKGTALALKTLGTTHIWISKHEDSLAYSIEALSLFKEQNDKKNEAETYYYLGANLNYLSDQQSAIKYHSLCYNLNKEINNELGMADGLNGLGTVYYTTGENEKALKALLESQELCIKHNALDIYVKVLDGIGETYLNLKKYKKAIEYFEKCVKVATQIKSKQSEAFALDGMGRTFIATKKYKNALEKFTKSISIRKKLGFKTGEVLTLISMGDVYISQKKHKEGIKQLNAAFNLAKKIKFKDGVYKSSQKLADIFEKTKQLNNSIKFYKLFVKTRDEISHEKTSGLVKSVELQNKMLQSDAEKLLYEEKTKELQTHSKNLVLLGEIGQQIISQLNVAKIVETVYSYVNNLMDAKGFGIGLHKPENNELFFPLYIEGENRYENTGFSLDAKNRLAVMCFNESKNIIINNFIDDIQLYIKGRSTPVAGSQQVMSLIYLPLKLKDKLKGVITVQSFSPNAYNEYHVNILKNIASYAAIALENARLYEEQDKIISERTKEVVLKKEEVEKAYQNNRLLSEIGQEITSTLNLEEIASKLHHYVNQLMDAACFSIRLYDPEKNHIEYKYGYERGERQQNAIVSMNDIDNYSVWCVKNRKEIFINDNLNEYKKYTREIKVVFGDLPHSLIFYPLMIGEKVLGCITVQSFEKNAYTDYHLDIIKTLASYSAIALDNANLYEHMEEKVKERTLEVVKQKEEIQKTYDNTRLLSQIGNDITSTLSIGDIIDKVYSNINNLMDAAVLGIGVYNAEKNEINFPASIEKGKKLPPHPYSLNSTERPAVKCFITQQDYVINNYSDELIKSGKLRDKPIAGASTESIIYVPITHQNKKIGVITVQSFNENAYTDYHVQILKTLAVYVAIAIDNASLYTNMEVRVKERTLEIEKAYQNNKLLSEIGQQISSTLSFEDIFEKLYKYVNQLMPAECFSVRIYHEETNTIEYKFEIEKGVRDYDVITLPIDSEGNYSGWCIKNKKEIFINDHEKEYKKYVNEIRVLAGELTHSLIFLPVMIGEKVLGVITVQSYNKNAYTDYHLDILKTLASYTATALENASLYENMEEKVKERTQEVVKQKEEIEKTYENTRLLSQIGKDITSTLSLEHIIDNVYASVNNLMDATGFGIGVHKPETNELFFPLYIEGKEKFKNTNLSLENENRLASICFNRQEEIVINNAPKEISKYLKNQAKALAGSDEVLSLMYLPLILKEKVIGVITVQSFLQNAYSDYHVQILKNLGVYVAIAIDNASLYQNMEDRVIERTKEVTVQKEQLEKNFQDTKLIAQITKDIFSSLSVDTIVSQVYENVNTLMKAESFGIGLYNPESQSLQFPGYIEKSTKMDFFEFFLSDKDRFAVWCFEQEKEILINDIQKEYNKYIKVRKPPIAGASPESIIYMPLFTKGKKIGVLTVQSFTKHAYSEYQINILRNLALSIAIAIDNANLYEHMEEKVKERTLEVVKQKEEIEKTYENTRLLSQIGKDISSTFSIEEIIKKVYLNINNLMDAPCFGIGMFNPETNEINFPATIENGKKLPLYSYPLTNIDRPAVWCYNSQKDYVINHFSEEFVKSNKVKDYQAKAGENPESIIYAPITHNEKKLGVITVQSFNANAYSDYHLQVLKNLAVYVAIAIDNASLYNNLEQRVAERTAEIEKNYSDTRLLSQIAEDISSSLSVETIISKVYQNVNSLMKADCFGIGIYNPQNNNIEFKGFVENDQLMDDFAYDASDSNRLASLCFINKKPILINDYATEYTKYVKGIKAPVTGKDSSSILYLPIFSKEVIIGVITVQSFEKNAYTAYHSNILKNLAISIGIALDNANLYKNLEEKVNERTLEVVKQKEEIEKTYENTRLLSQIGNDITSTLSIREIIEKVYTNINTLVDATGFGIGVYKKETNQIVFPLYIEGDEKFDNIIYNLEDKDRLTNICFKNKQDIIINNFDEEISQYVGYVQAPLQGKKVQSIIYLPLILKEAVLGTITIQSFNINAYNNYHLQILKNLAVYVAIAIDNASLYQDMEGRVIERTKEVTVQKEQLEKNFQDTKLIAQITKDITSSLSVETIVSKVYENVNNLMSAESFGVGLYNENTNSIQFPGFIERSEKMPFFEYMLEDKNRFAVFCFENETEIIINDLQKDFNKYIKTLKAPVSGGSPESIIYLPLFTKDKKIGVITVQSFTKNAYSEYQVNILRNLALSIAIAIDNANLYENLEEKVRERTEEVTEQKLIIEAKNKDITDSIRYAKKIQLAIIPDADVLKQTFPESFIYYRPKDIVSGDFYWIERFSNGVTVFAAADCTGHGVPGAFMSLICNDLMSQVIKDQNVTTPAQALTILDERLRLMLNKSTDHSSNDGMDIALCAYYPEKKLLQYAGAHRPLLLMRDGELIEYKPSKHSIGGYLTGKKMFADNNISVQKGDVIYILTDGYADQFGGENGKKFKFKRLQKLIMSISHLPMEDQYSLMENAFVTWRGKHEQVDDVCVIAIKI